MRDRYIDHEANRPDPLAVLELRKSAHLLAWTFGAVMVAIAVWVWL